MYYSYIIFLIYGTQTLVEKLLLILEPSSLIESKKGISMSSQDVTVELSEDDKLSSSYSQKLMVLLLIISY